MECNCQFVDIKLLLEHCFTATLAESFVHVLPCVAARVIDLVIEDLVTGGFCFPGAFPGARHMIELACCFVEGTS